MVRYEVDYTVINEDGPNRNRLIRNGDVIEVTYDAGRKAYLHVVRIEADKLILVDKFFNRWCYDFSFENNKTTLTLFDIISEASDNVKSIRFFPTEDINICIALSATNVACAGVNVQPMNKPIPDAVEANKIVTEAFNRINDLDYLLEVYRCAYETAIEHVSELEYEIAELKEELETLYKRR